MKSQALLYISHLLLITFTIGGIISPRQVGSGDPYESNSIISLPTSPHLVTRLHPFLFPDLSLRWSIKNLSEVYETDGNLDFTIRDDSDSKDISRSLAYSKPVTIRNGDGLKLLTLDLVNAILCFPISRNGKRLIRDVMYVCLSFS